MAMPTEQLVQIEGLTLVRYPNIGAPHATTTRIGGVSSGPYASLNVGLTTADDPECVAENRARLSRAVGFSVVPRVFMNHGTNVWVFDEFPEPGSPLPTADACISRVPGLGLAVTAADCVPITFYCPDTGAVGAAHAGWRGAVAGIAGKTIESMVRHYGCQAQRICVAIGPCIRPCCFEVDAAVAQEFANVDSSLVRPRSGPPQRSEEKFDVDLQAANRVFLERAGVMPENILISSLCSSCRPDLFFSHRRDKGLTGRMMTVIAAAS